MKKLVFCILAIIYPLSIWATPEIYFSQTYYKIKGYTAEELRKQLNLLGPVNKGKRYDAYLSWYINWNYNWRYDNPSQNPCYITELKVTAKIVSTLPEWEDKGVGDPNTQIKWDNFLSALITHEKGHEKNGNEAAIEVEKTLLSIPPQPSCKLLQDAIQSQAQSVIQQHNDWDVNYDVTTGHGKTQGAVFP
jgi:predicted secreted Zn-dependent protease